LVELFGVMHERLAALLNTASADEPIDALRARIGNEPADRVRVLLLAEYDRLLRYRNIAEWNELVRVCEALAIVGWGEREPVEALAERWVNGAWYTTLRTREFVKLSGHGNTADNTESEWSKQAKSFVLRGGEDTHDHGIVRFASQRLPLPKNPLRLAQRVANHQKSAAAFVEALSSLRRRLDRELAGDRYGEGFDYVGIACTFSNHDDEHETVRGEFFHDAKDVPKNFKGRYYVRPRLDFGKLTQQNGLWHWRVDRRFTRAEGEQPLPVQKQLFREDLFAIVSTLGQRLAKKKLRYDVERLRGELEQLLESW